MYETKTREDRADAGFELRLDARTLEILRHRPFYIHDKSNPSSCRLSGFPAATAVLHLNTDLMSGNGDPGYIHRHGHRAQGGLTRTAGTSP